MPANMKKAGIKYNKGGSLKAIPPGNKGLPKLPTSVRNKMGYMQKGGSLKPIPSENKGLPKLPRSVRNKMGYMKKGSEIKYGKGGTYNYKNFKNAKGQEVPGMYQDGGGNNDADKQMEMHKEKIKDKKFIDPRILDSQMKSDSIRNVLSSPVYPGNPNMLSRTPGNEVNVQALSQDEIDEYGGNGPIDPLSMTEEEMLDYDTFGMGNKYNTISPKIASYREMQDYDSDVKKYQEQSDKMNKMLNSGMSEDDAKSVINYKRKGGSTGRGPNGIL